MCRVISNLRKRRAVLLAVLLSALAGIGLASCSTVGYYAQAGWGGLRILSQRRPIEKLLDDPATPRPLRERLRAVRDARTFAIRELGLPDNGSYSSYADVGRPYASWIVVAAPELSLDPVRWCFPVAGCVTYRGYFSPRRAERFAAKLERKGFDVDVSGVRAFSTLGWFKDPVLSTFVADPPPSLAGLIFHELAHQLVYVQDDTAFNESFATLVELEGVDRWITARAASGAEGGPDAAEEVAGYREGKERQRRLVDLFSSYRQRLLEIYSGSASSEDKLQRKSEVFAELTDEHRRLYASWGLATAREEQEEEDELNNADLVSVQAYWDLVPAFRALLAQSGGDLAAFYEAVGELAERPAAERAAKLQALAPTYRNEPVAEEAIDVQ